MLFDWLVIFDSCNKLVGTIKVRQKRNRDGAPCWVHVIGASEGLEHFINKSYGSVAESIRFNGWRLAVAV